MTWKGEANGVRGIMRVIFLILVGLFLVGCTASGPLYSQLEFTSSDEQYVVIYRYSQEIGGSFGTWVPVKIELNKTVSAKLPNDSFLVINAPANDISLSVIPMVNLHYSDEYRLSLRDVVRKGEVAYFRLVSVWGDGPWGVGCTNIWEKTEGGDIAYTTTSPRSDWTQYYCLQRVPKEFALKQLEKLKLRRAN